MTTNKKFKENAYLDFYESSNYKYKDGKLYYISKAGEKEDTTRCIRNIKQYKLYAYRIESNVPFTRYILVDTETQEVYEAGKEHYIDGTLQHIVDELSGEAERRRKELQERYGDFDPLADLV